MEDSKEPDRYYSAHSGQWWSAARGEWIQPETEIRYGQHVARASKMADKEDILNETDQYIQKMEEVEKFRRESGESGASLSVSQVEPEVNIVVDEYQDSQQEESARDKLEEDELPVVLTVEGGRILSEEEAVEDLKADHALEESVIEPGIRLTVEGGDIVNPDEEQETDKQSSTGSGDSEVQVNRDEVAEVMKEQERMEEQLVEEQLAEEQQVEAQLVEEQQAEEQLKVEKETEEQEEEEKKSITQDDYEYQLKREPSVRGVYKSPEDYYRAHGYPELVTEPDDKHTENHSQPADHIASLHEPAERITSLHEPAERIASLHEPAERIASLHEPADRIASLHEPAEQVVSPPKPAARSASNAASSYKGSSGASRREEEEYEARVKVTLSQYKSEKSSSNVQVLQNIEKEEGNPDVRKLLAWAKGTRKSTTETMVVRQKNRESQIRKAVDVGGVNLVIAKKETPPAKAETKPPPLKIQNGSSMVEDISMDWCKKVIMQMDNETKVSILNIKIAHEQGTRNLMVECEVSGAKKTYSWHLKKAPTQNTLDKDAYILTSLGAKIARQGEGTKAKTMACPFQTAVYSDNQYILLPIPEGFQRIPLHRALDEAHLKVGARALAQLHALSYAFFKGSVEAGEAIKLLTDTSYQGKGVGEDTKALLERNLAKIALALEQEGMSRAEVDKVKALKSSLANIHRDALNPVSLLPVLCHGEPTTANLVFKYGADGQPTEAMLTNFSGCRYASAVTDLHIFINTTRDSAAREDFLLRFVYYETFVAVLKTLGIKVNFSYDDLKTEYVKKRLFGCLESCSLLLKQRPEVREATDLKSPTSPAAVLTSPTGPRPLESKILGRFIPKMQAAPSAHALPSKKNQPTAAGDQIQAGARVVELMAAAIKI